MDFTKFLNESKWKQLKPSDAAYNVYVKNSDIYNLNKEFFTVLIRG